MVAFYRSLSTTPLRLSAKRFRRRFYKSVSVTTTNDSQSHQINLDRHALRTPAGMPLLIRSEPLALCVAAEWDTQGRRIRHDRMHLTKLCNTAQDDPQLRDRQQIVADLLQQLDADTLCYRADDGSDLSALQAQLWDPLVHRVERRFQVEIGWSSALAGPTIPLGTRERFRRWLLAGFDRWALIGVAELVGELRSVVLSVALIERFVEVRRCCFWIARFLSGVNPGG